MTTAGGNRLSTSPSGKRRITAEDLYKFRYIGDPQISPDGRRVAFVVKTIDPEDKKYRSQIWLADLDGGEPQPLTQGPKSDRAPRWSPDGRTLAFLSDRGGEKAQVYLLPMSGGEARQLTKLTIGAGEPVWSPDGSQIAFVGRIGPDDPPPNEKPDKDKKDEKSDVKVITRARYKSDAGGMWDGRYNHIFTVPVPPGGVAKTPEVRQITDGEYDHHSIAWSPDGRQIAFVSNREPDRDFSWVSDIFVISAEGGEPRKLTGSTGPAWSPVWSPDGRWIAYAGHDNEFWGATEAKVWVVPAEGVERRVLTAGTGWDFGSSVGSDQRSGGGPMNPVWSPDSRTITFAATRAGQVHLLEVDVEAGAPSLRQLTSGRIHVFGFTRHAESGRLAYVYDTPLIPGDLAVLDPGTEPRRLTRLNEDWLKDVELVEPEHVPFQAEDGQPLDAWVMKPVGWKPGERYPLAYEIHGGPHTAYGYGFFHEFQLLAAQGYVVYYTNPRGSSAYGEQFAHIAGNWGDRDYKDIMAGLDHALSLGYVDEARLGVLGGSYGGYMTAWVIGHTKRFRAAISQRGLYNAYSFYGTSDIGPGFTEHEFLTTPWEGAMALLEHSPIHHVREMVTPLLIFHSENDFRCPIEQAEQLFVALKRLGREVEFVRTPGETHELSRSGGPKHRVERLNHFVRWFQKYLEPSKSNYTH